jgi:hypothetical protein
MGLGNLLIVLVKNSLQSITKDLIPIKEIPGFKWPVQPHGETDIAKKRNTTNANTLNFRDVGLPIRSKIPTSGLTIITQVPVN